MDEINGQKNCEEVTTMVFINCGGMINLTQMWFYQQPEPSIKCLILDSHRPYNHENIIDPKQAIIIIHDGCKSFEEYPTQEDITIY